MVKVAPPHTSRLETILYLLREAHPRAGYHLRYQNNLQLFIAVLLLPQSDADEVNEMTAGLFSRYHTAADLAVLPRHALEALIHPIGFARQKAKYIQESCAMIVNKYNGRVPSDIHALCQLPGVARKNANLIMMEAFQAPQGIVVDTHVRRVANRLQLSTGKNVIKVENDLLRLTPKKYWIAMSHLFYTHGRLTCLPRQPHCQNCPLQSLCPSAN